MFRLIYALFLSIMLTSPVIFAQANLVVRQASFEPQQIEKGDILTVRTTVVNVGNVAAAANYLFISYSQDLTIEPTELVSRVSIRPLAPGEEQEVEFFYPISTALLAGDYFVALEVDPFDEVPESDNANLFCVSDGQNCTRLTINNFIAPTQRYNYPIIFVHGLNGNSKTWDDFAFDARSNFGWIYGGRLDYCLNPDNNQNNSDTIIRSFVDQDNLRSGDFYTVNFDVNAVGELFVSDDFIPFNNFESNQSAIVKQGWAIRDAVEKVLTFSGADKVILVGHSMGGLASREYLQNPENWQPDGDHHVAKLLTIGTPHGGSNLSGGILSSLIGIDERAEATRDLRYTSPLFNGQYLNGGTESFFSGFVNNDVNCNGQTGDLIVGLNEKASPTLVDYACIVGVGNNFPSSSGDGVVDATRADFNNYLYAPPPLVNQHADRYLVTTSHTDIHKENTATIILALDEPDFYELAYPLPLERLQFSYASEQAENHPISPPGDNIDWDDFIIEVPTGGRADVRVWNIPVHTFSVFLYDLAGNLLAQSDAEGNSQLSLSANVPAGNYYVEFGSIPTANSWRFPYAHYVNITPAEPVVAAFSANAVQGCAPFSVTYASEATGNPTSFAWAFPGGTPATSILPNPTVTYAADGIYSASLIVNNETNADTLIREAYIEVSTTATPAFTHDAPSSRTVNFENETQFSGETPGYRWDFGDGQISTEFSPVHTFPANEIYEVTLTAENQCGATSTTQIINLTTVATADPRTDLAIALSPNPVKDLINLEVSGNFYGKLSATIINQIGQPVATKVLSKNNRVNSFSFDVENLTPGIYHLRLTASSLNRTIQFVKQ
ncbi:alpha/beta fold hydrolase [Neolewinella lacunae]|uniref:Alpha/beta fold hydrolase n=1 Tax=Neolewinella lacunae TaxID=1517758 RepID=A0A923TEH1_9BACT|nr:alpha/beta fold hydrolase [Neolewinella lacunae]MBC6995907.1 alpha/beta fold hydrolase [Neolewinella lacunae]MDN3636400.1 alpha/beta fold hydrolase [Neolewinella lacunae]